VKILLDYAREYIDAEYTIAYADIENVASTRVMEKCSMIYHKTDIAKGIPCHFYRIKNLTK
jgi:RimJ/RimL family protein N-acetyltransferase